MPDDNIIRFQPRPKSGKPDGQFKPPPMLNIPPATKMLSGVLIGVHLVIFALSTTLNPEIPEMAAYYGGFTPAAWAGMVPFQWWTPLSILTFSFLHGGWMHLGFNVVMLVSMGSGLEKTIGIKKYLMIYVGSSLFAIFAHLALYPHSALPIIGASGGISGIFGAMLVMMNAARSAAEINTKNTLLPVIIAYLVITIVMGLMGGPDGASVAWVAHIGGFLAGVGFMLTLLKRQK